MPRTILYVFCSEHFSGAEIVMERLLVANRDHVTPVALCSPGQFAERLRAAGIAVIEEPALAFLDRGRVRHGPLRLVLLLASRLVRTTVTLLRLRRRLRPDVVHANAIVSAFYALPAAALRRLAPWRREAWIWSNHDLAFPGDSMSAALARICYRVFGTTLVPSQAVRDRWGHAERTRVLYNGLDPERFRFDPDDRAAIRSELGIASDTVVIAIVGVVAEGKGHHLLVEAIRPLVVGGSDIFLAIVGRSATADPRYAARIEEMLRPLAGRARMLGFRSDVARLYSGIDILVNATTSGREEPLGTTIFEAMACERVVIATRTGGSGEIITDGMDGFLCPPDDAGALRECVASVLERWPAMDQLRQAARRTAVGRFGIERMRADYNRIVGAGQPGDEERSDVPGA